MTWNVSLFDRAEREPRNQWHPKYESLRDWLDAEAPPDQGQKLRNRSRYRRKIKPVTLNPQPAEAPATES